jgi:cell wall assembly regulator SMI1
MCNFRNFVKENEVWFRGKLPETDETLMNVESKLGVKLPEDIKWLLKEYGYWHGTGI